jgi:transcriptional regulator with XRE-family HTH domain
LITKKSPSPIDVYVGSRMRMRRTMLGMSQEKLGEAFGVSFQQVQKYEKGTNRMGSSRLQQATNVLGVPVSFFFEVLASMALAATPVSLSGLNSTLPSLARIKRALA